MEQHTPLIGPHEGRELDLMLAGTKKLALFSDLASAFQPSTPDWIPEAAFAPHVASGAIIRHMRDFDSPRQGTIRLLGYTLPGEEWRFEAAFFLRRDMRQYLAFYKDNNADDIVLGRLLSYTPEEINAFIERRARRHSKNT